MLFAKSAEKIDSFRPSVAASLFGEEDTEEIDAEED